MNARYAHRHLVLAVKPPSRVILRNGIALCGKNWKVSFILFIKGAPWEGGCCSFFVWMVGDSAMYNERINIGEVVGEMMEPFLVSYWPTKPLNLTY